MTVLEPVIELNVQSGERRVGNPLGLGRSAVDVGLAPSDRFVHPDEFKLTGKVEYSVRGEVGRGNASVHVHTLGDQDAKKLLTTESMTVKLGYRNPPQGALDIFTGTHPVFAGATKPPKPATEEGEEVWQVRGTTEPIHLGKTFVPVDGVGKKSYAEVIGKLLDFRVGIGALVYASPSARNNTVNPDKYPEAEDAWATVKQLVQTLQEETGRTHFLVPDPTPSGGEQRGRPMRFKLLDVLDPHNDKGIFLDLDRDLVLDHRPSTEMRYPELELGESTPSNIKRAAGPEFVKSYSVTLPLHPGIEVGSYILLGGTRFTHTGNALVYVQRVTHEFDSGRHTTTFRGPVLTDVRDVNQKRGRVELGG